MEPEPVAPHDAAEPLLDLEVCGLDALELSLHGKYCIVHIPSLLVCRHMQAAMPDTPELLGCCSSLVRPRARRWSWRRCVLPQTSYARYAYLLTSMI